MHKIYNLNEGTIPSIEQVGGKAYPLIRLTKGGFNVPGGSLLTVALVSALILTGAFFGKYFWWIHGVLGLCVSLFILLVMLLEGPAQDAR